SPPSPSTTLFRPLPGLPRPDEGARLMTTDPNATAAKATWRYHDEPAQPAERSERRLSARRARRPAGAAALGGAARAGRVRHRMGDHHRDPGAPRDHDRRRHHQEGHRQGQHDQHRPLTRPRLGSDAGASSMEWALLTPVLILVMLVVVQFTMVFH